MGLPVFKTGDAALGVAWWVRLPRAPATRRHGDRMSPSRPPGRVHPASSASSRVCATGWAARREAAPVLAVTRAVVDDERERLGADGSAPRDLDELAAMVVERLDGFAGRASTAPAPVINATGVIVHTNLGRAPWPAVAVEAAAELATGYLLLELDRETGRRGARARIAEDHLVALTGAEDALVTNNNAAALALAVGLAGRRRRGRLARASSSRSAAACASRTSFGAPAPGSSRSGRRTGPAPTTSRRRWSRAAPASCCASIRPTSRCPGSSRRPTRRPSPSSPTATARSSSTTSAAGALLDTAAYGLAHEPMPGERLATGSDLVTFSGDKLVGGPQAGLIVGRADLVARMRRDPLARAMRPDKVTMAGVAATLGLYRAGRATTRHPRLADDLDAACRRCESGRRRSWSRLGDRVDVGRPALDGRWWLAAGRDAPVGRDWPCRAASATRALDCVATERPDVIGRIEDDRGRAGPAHRRARTGTTTWPRPSSTRSPTVGR